MFNFKTTAHKQLEATVYKLEKVNAVLISTVRRQKGDMDKLGQQCSPWVSTAARLPMPEQVVLVCTSDMAMISAYISDEGRWTISHPTECLFTGNVTHWQVMHRPHETTF